MRTGNILSFLHRPDHRGIYRRLLLAVSSSVSLHWLLRFAGQDCVYKQSVKSLASLGTNFATNLSIEKSLSPRARLQAEMCGRLKKTADC